MTQHIPGNIHRRYRRLPEGFIPWKGGDCPLAPTEFVELMIRTTKGFGSSGITRASFHEWEPSKGVGSIAGYRTIRERS